MDKVNLMLAKEGWDRFKDVFLECEEEGCGIWQVVRVAEDWDGTTKRKFVCGICAGDQIEGLKKENGQLLKKIEKVERAPDKAEKELEKALKRDERREDKGKAEKKSFAEIVKKDIEVEMEAARKKMEESRVKAEQEMKKVVQVAVKESSKEELRKRRIIMLGLCKQAGKREEELVGEVLQEIMGTDEVRPIL